MIDHFQIFGLPRAFGVDSLALERRFRELSRELHPDKFATAPAPERRQALERSTALNDAYRVLRDPQRRAGHYLELNGLALEPGPEGRTAVTMSPEFLESFLDLRESFEGASAEERGGLRDHLTAERTRRLASLVADLGAVGEAPGREALVPLAQRLLELRYYDRFLNELDAELEGDLADPPAAANDRSGEPT